MKFNDIEYRASNFKGSTVDLFDAIEINKNIINILQVCIEKKIKLDINEKEFIKIIEIYYSVYGKYDNIFVKNISNLTIQKIDFVKILNNISK